VRIALFITCLTEQFYPRAAVAIVKVLEHLGHTVEFPAAQTCCGQPMFNNGLHDDARDLARRMIEIFAPAEHVVTPSGSCAAMVREHFLHLWPERSGEHRAALALAAKTSEFVEFLTKVERVDLRAMRVRWPGSVTYHRSCHLRSLGLCDEAETLLDQIEGVRRVPLPRAEQCCGFGGTFAVNYPQISAGMVSDKVSAIRETNAERLVCNEAGCGMNIAGACRRALPEVSLITIGEVIAQGLGLLPREGGSMNADRGGGGS